MADDLKVESGDDRFLLEPTDKRESDVIEDIKNAILNNEKILGKVKKEFDFRLELGRKKGIETDPLSIVRGLVGEMLAETVPFSESDLVVGADKLSDIGIIKLQTTGLGGATLEGKKSPFVIFENKKNLITFLSGEGVPSIGKFLKVKNDVGEGDLYSKETEMPDMWGGIVGVQGLAFPVEIKCYSNEEIRSFADRVKEIGRIERTPVNIDGVDMVLGFDPGKQIDLIDWARGRTELPSIVEDQPRPVLLRVPRGMDIDSLRELGDVAEKGVYGKNEQRIVLLVEELPFSYDEIEGISRELMDKMEIPPGPEGESVEEKTASIPITTIETRNLNEQEKIDLLIKAFGVWKRGDKAELEKLLGPILS